MARCSGTKRAATNWSSERPPTQTKCLLPCHLDHKHVLQTHRLRLLSSKLAEPHTCSSSSSTTWREGVSGCAFCTVRTGTATAPKTHAAAAGWKVGEAASGLASRPAWQQGRVETRLNMSQGCPPCSAPAIHPAWTACYQEIAMCTQCTHSLQPAASARTHGPGCAQHVLKGHLPLISHPCTGNGKERGYSISGRST
jgi:hypothetical protein